MRLRAVLSSCALLYACVGDEPTGSGPSTPDGGGVDGGGDAPVSQGSVVISGELHFLQRESLIVENNGIVQTLSQNGRFDLSQKVDPGAGYDVKIVSHPPKQTCWVKNGKGTANSAVANVEIRCSVALHTASIPGQPGSKIETTSAAFVDLAGVDPIAFDTDVAESDVLLTFVAPRVRAPDVDPGASGTPTVYGLATVGIDLDGEVVAEGSCCGAFWGGPGSVPIATAVKVPAGKHLARVKWKKETSAARPAPVTAEYGTALPSPFSATVLTSLAAVDAVHIAKTADDKTTSSSTPISFGLAANTTVAEQRAVLTLLHVPLTYREEVLEYAVTVDDLAVATARMSGVIGSGAFVQPLSRVTLGSLAPGAHSFGATWKTNDKSGAQPKDRTKTLAALVLSPSARSKSTTRTGFVESTAQTMTEIPGLDPVKLDLVRDGRILVAFETTAAGATGNHANGEIDVTVDGVVVAAAHVGSEESTSVQPVSLYAVADATAGTHTVTARFRYTGAFQVGTQKIYLVDGRTSLAAVALE